MGSSSVANITESKAVMSTMSSSGRLSNSTKHEQTVAMAYGVLYGSNTPKKFKKGIWNTV
jgi:hypothetical protein